MTTIAFDGTTLAADAGLIDENKLAVRFSGKLRRLKDGRLAGFAGNVVSGLAILDWLDIMSGPLDAEENATVMVIDTDKRIYTFDNHLRGCPIDETCYAIGSGSHLAWGAMLAGATAERAVEIAVQRDTKTNFGVISLVLGTPPPKKRPKK